MDEAPVGITITDPDRPDNPIVYVNDAFERITGYRSADVLGRNCRFLQGADTDPEAVATLQSGIEAGEPVTVELRNYRKDGEPFWNEVTVAPVSNDAGEVTNYVGFQVDVTRRKEAQLALAAERERLDRLVDRVNGLLADVTELLMHGVDREETERAIVERVAATDAYQAAWIGEPDLARDVLVTSSTAGAVDAKDVTVDLSGNSPVARAYGDGRVVAVDVDEQSGFGQDAPTGRLAAVPLVYGEATYGVLVVVGADADALDDRELVVLESVGRTIATAINAARSRRGLTADDLAELTFTIGDEEFFPVALADAWDCRLAYRGSTTDADDRLKLYFDAESGGSIADRTTPPLDGVESVTLVGGGETALVEVVLEPGSVLDRLAERGAAVRSLTADGDGADVEVVVPVETGGRVVLELLEERFDGVALTTYRERERRPTTRASFVDALEEDLTGRQVTALYGAYYGGYYDEPRLTTGDELAAAMGVSRQTFHQHLRAAERKLLAAILE
jgi:PAS domain S-box-containing protein